MSLANLSIIEKDDLIKKMPKDALKRELRDPTGNLPLYMIAARLKEVETMEKEFQAKQFAQDAQGEEPTIAHRLAREIMPQAPISGMAAMPSPQQRPNPQGQMAQQLAGPQNPMPTVYAQSGLKGAYPGDAPRVTAEMLAAAARRRKDSGKSRLYNQDRKSSFEETIKKGASPAAQMAAMFGIPSAIARQEERVYGGLDTLTPYQTEYNPLALRSKGFTSPTRTLSPGKDTEDASGLDYLKIMKGIAGDSDGLPTVFAENGRSPFATFTLPQEYVERQRAAENGSSFANIPLVRDVSKFVTDYEAEASAARKKRNEEIALRDKATLDPFMQYVSGDPQSLADAKAKSALYRENQDKIRAQEEAQKQALSKTFGKFGDNLNELAESQEGQNLRKREELLLASQPPVAPVVTAAQSAAPPETDQALVVNPYKPLGAPVMPMGSSQASTGVGEVPTLEASIRTFDGLLPENKRADVVKQREEEARKVEGQDPVPKGIKDIRALMDKRLKSLDNSGLPFMTAAAAVIKGNQPTLVALTNAMIGYTAGDEQLKKQGMSIMKEMVEVDTSIATLEAGQRKAEAEARSQIIAAREADIKGDEERQARTLQLAMKNIEIASEAKSAKERVRASERNSVRNYMATVAKTETERNRRMAAFDAHQKDNPSASKFESMQAVENLLAPRSGLGLDRALSRDAKINSQVEKFYKSIRDNNAGSFGGWREAMKNQGIERANQMDVINWAIDNNMVSVPDDYNEAVRKVIFDRAAGKATANQGGGQPRAEDPLNLNVN